MELGRIDIYLEVSMMSSHLALPREGYLDQVFQIFAYLKKYHNAELVYDPSDLVVNEHEFEQRDWMMSEFGHLRGVEVVPPIMPEPQAMGFVMRAKVDADHAADTVTRRSRMGFLVYLNSGLVYWWSKKQTGMESSSFGSEFIAMKRCCEYIKGLRYKLQMMGIRVVVQPISMVITNLCWPIQPSQILPSRRKAKVLPIILSVKDWQEMNGEQPTLTCMTTK